MNIKKEQELLKSTGKLSTHPHIHCCKCQSKTTAFGSNLQNKISKAGGLEELLSSFECRACRSANSNKVRLPKANKQKRGSKGRAKEAKKADLLKNLPQMNFTRQEPIVLVSNPEFAAEVTAHSCLRPDIYLDSSRSCDFCSLYSVCKAPCRRVTSQGWQFQAA
jgi:hypothetical protein